MIKLKSLIRENNIPAPEEPPVILGAIWPDGELKALRGETEVSRHPREWLSCNKWRYVPEIHYLNWYEEPTPMEKEIVIDYLTTHGFNVKYSKVYSM